MSSRNIHVIGLQTRIALIFIKDIKAQKNKVWTTGSNLQGHFVERVGRMKEALTFGSEYYVIKQRIPHQITEYMCIEWSSLGKMIIEQFVKKHICKLCRLVS